jgi:hypothetical protein
LVNPEISKFRSSKIEEAKPKEAPPKKKIMNSEVNQSVHLNPSSGE